MAELHWGSCSITGNFRENNEDLCFIDPQGRFFLVADGMGGQAAGEKASAMAIEIVKNTLVQHLDSSSETAFDVHSSVNQAVSAANIEIMALGEIETDYRNMGTTLVFVLCLDDKAYVGGVGDSRCYILRGSSFRQITTDHSITQALIDAGTINPKEASTHRYRNVLYRYLGTKEGGTGVEPEEIELEENDRLLLCSDGVNDGLSDVEIVESLKGESDSAKAAEAVVNSALEGGSRDNITAVVVDIEKL